MQACKNTYHRIVHLGRLATFAQTVTKDLRRSPREMRPPNLGPGLCLDDVRASTAPPPFTNPSHSQRQTFDRSKAIEAYYSFSKHGLDTNVCRSQDVKLNSKMVRPDPQLPGLRGNRATNATMADWASIFERFSGPKKLVGLDQATQVYNSAAGQHAFGLVAYA